MAELVKLWQQGGRFGTGISPLHRHRLLWRGDARIQLQGAAGLRRRGLRHAGTCTATEVSSATTHMFRRSFSSTAYLSAPMQESS